MQRSGVLVRGDLEADHTRPGYVDAMRSERLGREGDR
jgi:hypothetical protein